MKAAASQKWCQLFENSGAGAEREKTEVRIWYDGGGLYLGWTCVDSDIQATFTARGSKFWEEKVVEFLVASKTLARELLPVQRGERSDPGAAELVAHTIFEFPSARAL